MFPQSFVLCGLLALAKAQSGSDTTARTSETETQATRGSGVTSYTWSVSLTDAAPSPVSPTYIDYTSQIILSNTTGVGVPTTVPGNATRTGTETTTQESGASTSGTGAVIGGTAVGTTVTLRSNETSATSISSIVPSATNRIPCNNYPEFCNRKYSNVTEVSAHNSMFTQPNNVARNQDYGVIAQLNDGIRMRESASSVVHGQSANFLSVQGQFHPVDGPGSELHFCHSSCDLLDAGPVVEYFRNVTAWLEQPSNRYEVVTILLGNYEQVWVENLTDPSGPIAQSEIRRFLYEPPKIPMYRDDWPTLAEMIVTNKRVVLFMDYMANQGAYNYVLDEFSHIWETPFSPTDPDFPCIQQRPPDISTEQAERRMYMANHNLNIEIAIAGLSILVPNTVQINQTNSAEGDQSLGLMGEQCTCELSWHQIPVELC